MPLGAAFHSLNLANPAAGGGGGDPPTIPTLSWTGNSWDTATWNNTTHVRTTSMVGMRADGKHYLTVRGDTSNGRIVHNENRNLSQSLGLGAAPTAANSTSVFSTTTDRGGNVIGVFSTATRVRATVGAVADWATTPTQTSNPAGAIGSTLFTRTSGTNTDIAICNSPLTSSSTSLRAIAFWNSNGSLFHAKFIAGAAASTLSSQTATTSGLSTGATGIGNHMSAVSFTTDVFTVPWMVSGFNGTDYRVSWGTTDMLNMNSNATTIGNDTAFLTTSTASGGGMACAWDDFANNKRVAVAMVLDGNTVKMRAINSSGTAGTANDSVVTSVFQARVCNVKTTSSNGFGMVLLTYLKSSATAQIHGRLISVDSTTLDLTVGPEMLISGANYTIVATPSYGIDAARDGSTYHFTTTWSQGINNNGGASYATATG